MDKMPIVGEPVYGRILAHRRNSDAISQRDVFDLKWFEEYCHWFWKFSYETEAGVLKVLGGVD